MVIHGKLLFVNYLFVKQFTYYSFLLNLQSKQATTMKIRLEQPSDYRTSHERRFGMCIAQDAMSISCSTSLGTTLTSFPNSTS